MPPPASLRTERRRILLARRPGRLPLCDLPTGLCGLRVRGGGGQTTPPNQACRKQVRFSPLKLRRTAEGSLPISFVHPTSASSPACDRTNRNRAVPGLCVGGIVLLVVFVGLLLFADCLCFQGPSAHTASLRRGGFKPSRVQRLFIAAALRRGGSIRCECRVVHCSPAAWCRGELRCLRRYQ